jgi:Flp pilus assembly pilin Flp
MFAKFWNDESGVVAIEYLFLSTIVGIGLVVGFCSLARAINVEYAELGNAILALNQSYSVSGTSGCACSVTGSAATDTAGLLSFAPVAPPVASNINVTACP